MFLQPPPKPPIKSPLNYTGGKFKLVGALRWHFPDNIKTFVDLFAGGLNVTLNIEAQKYIVNDRLHFLIDLFKHLREIGAESAVLGVESIVERYGLSKTSKEGYLKLRRDFNLSEKKDPLIFFSLIAHAFNYQIRFNGRHEFNMPFGKGKCDFSSTMRANLIAMCENLQRKEIAFMSEDFRSVDLSGMGEEDFLYCDPPYLITTATYNDGKRGFGGWGEESERALYRILDGAHNRGVRFALSNVIVAGGKENEMLREWSSAYRVIELKGRFSHFRKGEGSKGEGEVLIVNYPHKYD